MILQSRLKWRGTGAHRVESPRQTIRRIKATMRQIGVTRIADSTDLDTLGIPVFSAIRPTDAGMDGISVYNGKGLTKAESLAGAMMEAIERYCGESWPHAREQGTYRDMRQKYPDDDIVDPAALYLHQLKKYDDQKALEWGKCWDLISHKNIFLPLNFIISPFYGSEARTWQCNTNGLASGNHIEEAICHALAELIERDAYSLALIGAQVAPRFSAVIDSLSRGHQIPDPVPVDRSRCPLVDLATLPVSLRRLTARAVRQGVKLWLRDIRSDLGIPTFMAAFQQMVSPDREFVAAGFGCHPNATIAASRAITEAAQGRLVQVQGTREDAAQIGGYRFSERVLWGNDEGPRIAFSSIDSYDHADIVEDISLMLNRLRDGGMTSVIVADLTQSSIPAAVVKIVIPGLETWMLNQFSEDKANLGWRAQSLLKRSLRNTSLAEAE